MMILNDRLYDRFIEKAARVSINILSLGLGYTAVATSDGGIGLSYTYFADKTSCMVLNKHVDYEGKSASKLLSKIKSDLAIERSMALALINALNHRYALTLPEDKGNTIMFDKFDIHKGTKVAMVGYFGPLIQTLKQKNVSLEILDESRALGRPDDFYIKLKKWADVLLLTSTSILNNTTEEILSHVHADIKTVMLGPSTPMVAEVFRDLPVDMLAGTVPIETESVLKAVRHGMGTPVLHKYSRKSFLAII